MIAQLLKAAGKVMAFKMSGKLARRGLQDVSPDHKAVARAGKQRSLLRCSRNPTAGDMHALRTISVLHIRHLHRDRHLTDCPRRRESL